ncbi:MAG: putative Ig domain-containing protein [Candidatus Acidiferrales bacterium]
MGGRARFSLIRCLFVLAVLGIAGCAGTPSDFDTVVLRPSATQVAAGGTVTITASVPKDSTNAGVTWVIAPGPGAPMSYGTFLSTNTQATFTAPMTVSGSYYVTITATSIAIPTESNSVKITVQPPQPLKITTTSLPNGTLGAPYTATTLQATGGVPPYTWTITVGSLPPGLALNNGIISGTPTGTTTGTTTFTVQVADSEVPAMTKTASLSITIANLLSGNYAFEFSGFNTNGAVVAAGTFTSDGVSKISSGVADFNTIAGTPSGGTLETFTGTYTIGTDGRGTLTFNTSASGTVVYAFALNSQGLHGRLVESDSSGVTGSGEIAQQNVTTCASSTLSGTNGTGYVFGATGYAAAIGGSTAGPVVLVGRFTAEAPPNSSTPGSIDTGEADANIPGIDTGTTFELGVSGTFATTTQPDRCTMTFEPGTLATETYSVYPVFATGGLVTEAFIVETDTVSSTNPTNPYLTVGKMYQQVGYPFVNAESSLDGTASSVAGLSGNILNGAGTAYLPDVAVSALTGSAGTTFTMSVLENQAGTLLNYGTLDGTFQTVDTFGRLGTDIGSPIGPTFYVIDTNEALCIGEINNEPFYGLFEPQSDAPFSGAAALNGAFAEGTLAPSTNTEPNYSGAITLANSTTTSGTFTGTEDASGALGQIVTGTYNSFVAATGAGNVALTAPITFSGAFLAVSPTKIAMISTTTGDANPVVVILGDQTDDFGVN